MPLDVRCPYCGNAAELVTGAVLYPHRHDLHDKHFWQCRPCDARVGTHPDAAHTPLGRLANATLRSLKQQAHAAFDWTHETGHFASRSSAYRWLAGQLNIPPRSAHIGMFDEEQCRRTIEICSEYRQRVVDNSGDLIVELLNNYRSAPVRNRIEDLLHAPAATQETARPNPVARPRPPTGEDRGEAHWRLGGSRKRLWPSSW